MKLGYTCPPSAPEPSLSIFYIDETRRMNNCPGVYEPADDTWLTYHVLDRLAQRVTPRLCLDIGTGTGVLAAACSNTGYIVSVDVNPCAVGCAVNNLRRLGYGPGLEVVQSSLASWLRCPLRGPLLAVFNTPYLPEGSETGSILDTAWTGGPGPARRLIDELAGCITSIGGCIVLTTLADWAEGLQEEARSRGLQAGIAARERFFFEEVVVVTACSPDYA